MTRRVGKQWPRDVNAADTPVNGSYAARHRAAQLDRQPTVVTHDRITDRLVALAQAQGLINAAPSRRTSPSERPSS